MTWWGWALLGVVGYALIVWLIVALVRGGAAADRVEHPTVRVYERGQR